MSQTVHSSPEARDQLDELESLIADAGSPMVAARYVDCGLLREAANLSTPRYAAYDLRPGLRTLGFRRRVTILFEVTADTVNIIGLYYGGQDYEASLRDSEP